MVKCSVLRAFYSAVLLIIFSATAFADNAIQVTGVTRASNYTAGTGSAAPIIFGGIAGLIANCQSTTSTGFCDNCVMAVALGGETACNTRRIHSNLLLHIDFKVTGDITGAVFFAYSNSGTPTALTPYSVTSGTLTKNSTGTIEIEWSKLCELSAGLNDSTCEGGSTIAGGDITAYIGLGTDMTLAANRIPITIRFSNPDNDVATSYDLIKSTDVSPSTGIIGFAAQPGDEKVYITDLSVLGTCPSTYKYARIYYSQISENADDGTNGLLLAQYGAEYKDLKFGTNCAQNGDWTVDGLVNDQPYIFRSAIVDDAYNVVFLIDSNEILATQGMANCIAPGSANDAACPYIATPGQVDGMLTKDFNCFITTAAYGSAFSTKVETFRQFRNHFLLTSDLGTKLVKYYYKVGPGAARFIAQKSSYRAITRFFLAPLWGFAWLSLHYGIFGALIQILFWLTLLFYFFNKNSLQELLQKFSDFTTLKKSSKISSNAQRRFILFSFLIILIAPTINVSAAESATTSSTAKPIADDEPFFTDETSKEKPREKLPVSTSNDSTSSSSTDFLEENPDQTAPHISQKKQVVEEKFRSEKRYIEHPNASRGLIKIDKDRVYHYKVKTSEQTKTSTFKLGSYDPSKLGSPTDSNLTYTNMYDQTDVPFMLYDQTYVYSKKFGVLSWKLGGGFLFARGHGQFTKPNNDPAATPLEKFTFFAFPLNAGLTYQLKYFKNQWIIPYAEGAADAFLFGESRDDNKKPALGAAFGFAPAAHFSLGGQISLGKNADSFLDLDREYGINAIYLTFEYRTYIALSNKYDFSGEAITGGVTADY